MLDPLRAAICYPAVIRQVREDPSNQVIQDDVFARLLTFPNVVITAHQAFFTETALGNIAATTLANISDFEQGRPCANVVTLELARRSGQAG